MNSKTALPDAQAQLGRDYRFSQVRLDLVLRDMYYPSDAPRPGDKVPDFELPTIDGGCIRTADLKDTGPVLLVFGSMTCPVTDSAAPGLRKLHGKYGGTTHFIIVNVREAHPGAKIPQPQSFNEKASHARGLRDLHDFAFDVGVDDIDGTLHRALSPKPNSAYLIGKDKTIIFRAQWGNDTEKLAQALKAVAAGEIPAHSISGGLIRPILRTLRFIPGALDRAGNGAWGDMWRAVFPLAAAAWIIKALQIRPPLTPN